MIEGVHNLHHKNTYIRKQRVYDVGPFRIYEKKNIFSLAMVNKIFCELIVVKITELFYSPQSNLK